MTLKSITTNGLLVTWQILVRQLPLFAWNGFPRVRLFDSKANNTTSKRRERLEMFATTRYFNSHIIYDAIRGTYINDYIPEAIPFISNHAPIGMYGRMAYNQS